MAGKQVGLDYFSDHLDQLPTNPAILEKLQAGGTIDLDDLGVGDDEVGQVSGDNMDVTEGEAKDAKPEGGQGEADQQQASDKDEGEQGKQGETTTDEGTTGKGKASGVATPSGKGVIPYGVLKGARERAEQLQTSLEQAQARIAELESGRDTAAEAVSMNQVQDSMATLESMLADIDPDESGESRKLVETVSVALRGLSAQVGAIAERINQGVQHEQAQVKQSVGDAMAEVPSLLLWQAEHPQVFEAAIQIDDALRALPAWRGKPMSERFAEAARQVRMAMPDAPIAEGDPAFSTKQFNPNPTPVKDRESVAAAAAKKLAAVEQNSDQALTLSDLRGGDAGDVQGNSISRLEHALPTELAELMGSMDKERLDEFLSGLGQTKPRSTLGGRARAG